MENNNRIKEIEKAINKEKKKGCSSCNDLGLYHCSYLEECGNWDKLIELEKERDKLNRM